MFGETLWLRMSVESGEVILGRPGSFVTGMPVGAAARLIRYSAPGEILVGERAATTTCGAFELVERDGAYVLVGMLTPTRSPAQRARRRRRSRALLAATGALLIVPRSRPRPSSPPTPITRRHSCPRFGRHHRSRDEQGGRARPVGRRPDGVAFGANAVWVANLDDKTLSRIDPKSRIEAGTVPLGATPTGLAVGFGSVWVAHGLLGTRVPGRAAVRETSKTIRPPVAALAVEAGAHGSIAVGAGSVWVAFGDSSVFRIDPVVSGCRRRSSPATRRPRLRTAVKPSGLRTRATAVSRGSTRRRTGGRRDGR